MEVLQIERVVPDLFAGGRRAAGGNPAAPTLNSMTTIAAPEQSRYGSGSAPVTGDDRR
jgi:hypothetical protein